MGSLNTDNTDPPVPRILEEAYGLYPGLDHFSGEYGAQDYGDWVEQSNGDPLPAPLAVYITDSCNRVPAPEAASGVAAGLARAIEQELRLQGALFDSDRPLQQVICAGNIASGWSDDQLYGLVSAVQSSFTMDKDGAPWCVCLASTDISQARLRLLQVLGFRNIRLALRLDDSREAGRSNLLEQMGLLAGLARRLGVQQIMIDLYYNPAESAPASAELETFLNGVQPELIRLVELAAPGDTGRHDRYVELIARLGYENIGLDWFARSGDLWCGARASRLYWSLFGFTNLSNPDVIGVGPGAISTIGDFYSQNEYRWKAYQNRLAGNAIPSVRGLELESDDRLRREIMAMMLTDSRIDVRAVENKWGIQFDRFFCYEIQQLRRPGKAPWVNIGADSIAIKVRGRRELSELCRIFDHRSRTARSAGVL